MAERTRLEICVEGVADARAAMAGGADRVELCVGLGVGGLTPSPALVAAVAAVGLPVHVLVRPGEGGFVHDADTVALIARDIGDMVARGAAGVVVGALDRDGGLDREGMARWRDAAGTAALTLHRAVDLARSPVTAVEEAARLGVDHVLTSGGAPSAWEGAETIAAMVAAAAGRVRVMAGGGVTADNAAALLRRTGVAALHASASVRTPWHDARIPAFGFGGELRREASVARIAALRDAMDRVRRDQ